MKYPTIKRGRWTLLRRGRLIVVAAAVLFLAFSAQAQPRITAASNPVVVPNGQVAGTTTITWKAAPDYNYSEIYLSVDNGEWSEFAKGGDGSKVATLKLGSSYTFRMMIYQGQQGTPKIITTLTITTVLGNPTPPPPSGGGIGTPNGRYDERAGGGATRVLFGIREVQVQADRRYVIIRFKGPPNQVPYVAIGRAAPISSSTQEWAFGPDQLVGGGFVGPGVVSAEQKARGEYVFTSAAGTTISSDGLEPSVTYHYIITVPGSNGRRAYQDTGSFTTLRESTTVKVVWERVLILDDSDKLSTGEIQFWFWANYGHPSQKYAYYRNDDADDSEAYNIDRTVVVDNAPNTLTLAASGLEQDSSVTQQITQSDPPLDAPASTDRSDLNVAKDTFDLRKYADNTTVPFVLNAVPGNKLNFVIFGRLEITRGTGEQIGTASSALSTGLPPPRQFIGTFGTTPANYQPLWIYAIKDDGDLLWYRKDTGTAPWQGPNKVGNGWDFKDVIPAGGNSFYALTADGKLFWYQHTGFNDGTRTWKDRVEVGHGWSYASVFSGGEGIIYAITNEGKLLWYKHNAYRTGAGLKTPGAWENPKEVGRGWGGFEQVFSSGGGIIYAITKDGKLRWYKHNGYLTGAGLETTGAWDGPREVGRGWNGFRQIVPAGDGVILAIQNDGKLRWYKHNGYLTGAGLETPGAWDGPKEVGSGWQGFKKVFALLPVSSTPVVR